MSLKSPLGQVMGLGSARGGTGHWWSQRVSALALLFLGLWFAAELICLESLGYQSLTTFMSSPVNAVLLVLLVATLFFHSLLGIQVVIEDYIHGEGTKMVCLIGLKLGSFALGVAAAFAVLKVAF